MKLLCFLIGIPLLGFGLISRPKPVAVQASIPEALPAPRPQIEPVPQVAQPAEAVLRQRGQHEWAVSVPAASEWINTHLPVYLGWTIHISNETSNDRDYQLKVADTVIFVDNGWYTTDIYLTSADIYAFTSNPSNVQELYIRVPRSTTFKVEYYRTQCCEDSDREIASRAAQPFFDRIKAQ